MSGGPAALIASNLLFHSPFASPCLGSRWLSGRGVSELCSLGYKRTLGPPASHQPPSRWEPPPVPSRAFSGGLPPASCPPASPDGAGGQGTLGHRGGGTGDSGAGRRPRQTARGLPRRVTRHVTQLGPARVVSRSCDAAVLSFKTRLQSICGRSMQQPSRRSILRSRPPPPPPPLPPPPIDALRAPVAILGGERGRQKEGPVGTGIALGSAARAGAPPPRRWEPASRERCAPL